MGDYCIHGKYKLDSDPCEECLNQNWLDKQFSQSIGVLLIASLLPCTSFLFLVFTIVGMIGCRDAKARKRAVIAFFWSLCLRIIAVIIKSALR
jgi:hypothetical protein